jgi:hypothetical protein
LDEELGGTVKVTLTLRKKIHRSRWHSLSSDEKAPANWAGASTATNDLSPLRWSTPGYRERRAFSGGRALDNEDEPIKERISKISADDLLFQ